MALIQKLVHKEDPREVILRQLGSLDGFDIAAQGVLVATYLRPDDIKTEGGVLIPHAVVKDDPFQSKSGLVVKLGRRAFEDDEHIKWHGYRCDPGDWVAFRASDGMTVTINGTHCRLIADVHLKIKIPHADSVF